MGEVTNISWCESTFNAWRGCARVSPGCEHCYAEKWALRDPTLFGHWGTQKNGGTRVAAAEGQWRMLRKLNAQATGTDTHRVFSASNSDWLEDWQGPMLNANGEILFVTDDDLFTYKPVPVTGVQGMPKDVQDALKAGTLYPLQMTHILGRLLMTIEQTRNLEYLLLTKRPENFRQRMLAVMAACPDTEAHAIAGRWLDGRPPGNVWAMTTVENQEYAVKRMPALAMIPAVIRGLSVEPMLGPVDLVAAFDEAMDENPLIPGSFTSGLCEYFNWVICGGESGSGARPFNLNWARRLRDQCFDEGLHFFMKQLGDHAGTTDDAGAWTPYPRRSHHGTDIATWPADLQVQLSPKTP